MIDENTKMKEEPGRPSDKTPVEVRPVPIDMNDGMSHSRSLQVKIHCYSCANRVKLLIPTLQKNAKF